MSGTSKKILIIDDDPALRRIIIKGLRPFNLEVIECDNGRTGLQLARAQLPSLIICDVNMEPGDGFSVLDELRRDPLLAGISLILMTGQADAEGMRRGMDRGADDYLAKPFSIEALLATVEARLFRRRIEESTQRLFLQIIEATTDLVGIANLADHRVLHLNRAGRKLAGLPAAETLDSWTLERFYSPTAWRTMEAVAIPTAVSIGVWTGDTTLVNRDGREIPVSQVLIVHADGAGAPEQVSFVARDLSERIHAERFIADSYAQLRGLTGRLVAAQEAERGRIAREIHDEFAQQLTGLKMDLAWLEKRIGESEALATRSQLLEKTAAMHEQIKTTIQTVRRIATELRPAILDSLGLIAALEWQAKEFQERTGIPCDFQCSVDHITWQGERSTALFRIFQETLTNVARHAQARSVWASLTQVNDTIRLRVQDDGKGISDSQQVDRKSLGLLGMKERAFLAGGRLRITGGPGTGTTVEVDIPLDQKAPEV